jgi:hypothetical protein
MKNKKKRGILQSLCYLYGRIISSGSFNIQRRKLIFKSWRKASVITSNPRNLKIDSEKYEHSTFTRPVPEK